VQICSRSSNRLDNTIHTARTLRWNGEQYAGGTHDIDDGYHGCREGQSPRHCTTRVPDLAAHEGNGFRARVRECQRRPEDNVAVAESRRDGVPVDPGRRSESNPTGYREYDQQCGTHPARNGAGTVEPLGKLQPANI